MITLHWTERAQDDLAVTQAFIDADSPAYANVVVRRLIGAAQRRDPHHYDPSQRAWADRSPMTAAAQHGMQPTAACEIIGCRRG